MVNFTKDSFTRRQFIKTSSIAALMSSSIFNFLKAAFGQDYLDEDFLKFLNVTGIYPDKNQIGPQGIHLRWM
ncbi:MAG: hypothetical protein WAT71_02500, partial [Ignavibacteria bacterium]